VAFVTYPVFVVCRDRLACLVSLLEWLESVGNADEVYLIDQASTWAPLLAFYDQTEHTVIRTDNVGHKVGWSEGIIRQHAAGRRFIYTDPDVLPLAECPDDALARMAQVLDRTKAVKCGFSIKIDDLAPWIADRSIAWEQKYWDQWDVFACAYRAPIDTTFAMYSTTASTKFRYSPAYRLPAPYSVRHLPWYMDPLDLDAETAHYVANADPAVSNWTRDVLAETGVR
jgi:hypothetical protein